jgi:hypothetical protein
MLQRLYTRVSYFNGYPLKPGCPAQIFCDVIYRTKMTLSLFTGVPQSKYAAMAILAAIIIVSLSLLLGKDPIPLSQKFAFVLLIFLVSLPGLLLTLFQLTCLVTGAGFRNQRWWCSAYAWIISILLIIYCVFLIAVAVITLATGEKVIKEIETFDNEALKDVLSKANNDAAEYFATEHKSEDKAPEGFEQEPHVPEDFKVSGGASVPAPVEPEAFNNLAVEEPFTNCGAPL